MTGLQVGLTRARSESVELLILITILILSFGVAFAIQKVVLGALLRAMEAKPREVRVRGSVGSLVENAA